MSVKLPKLQSDPNLTLSSRHHQSVPVHSNARAAALSSSFDARSDTKLNDNLSLSLLAHVDCVQLENKGYSRSLRGIKVTLLPHFSPDDLAESDKIVKRRVKNNYN